MNSKLQDLRNKDFSLRPKRSVEKQSGGFLRKAYGIAESFGQSVSKGHIRRCRS